MLAVARKSGPSGLISAQAQKLTANPIAYQNNVRDYFDDLKK